MTMRHLFSGLIALALTLLPLTAQSAGPYYAAQIAISQGPLSNSITTTNASMDYLLGSNAILSGGTMATTSVTNNTTNFNIWSTPLDISYWNTFVIEATCTQVTNNGGIGIGQFTNYLWLLPSADNSVFDTNRPILIIWSGTNSTTLGTNTSTNAILVTNIAPAAGGVLPRYWWAVWGCQGTNSVTNCTVQAYVRGTPFVTIAPN